MCCDQCNHYFGCEEVQQQVSCCGLCEELDECHGEAPAGHRVVDGDDDLDFDKDHDDGEDEFDDDDEFDDEDDDDYDDVDEYGDDDDDDDDDDDEDDEDDDRGYLHDRYRPDGRH